MLTRFFHELRRRGVFGTTALYVVGAWVFVQVMSEVLPAFNLPDFAIRYVWIFVVLCLPLAVFLGWRYDISTQGVKRTRAAGAAGAEAIPLGRLDFLLLGGLGLLTFGLATVLTSQILGVQERFTGDLPPRDLDPHSIAVLPLDNFTGDPDQDYFVAGLHEALTAGLTHISALKVISRTSASAFAGSNSTVPEIGRALGVRNIIEGSVFRSGDQVRITVQLIDALTDEHLWAENFERELHDLLVLQAEVTRAITRQIRVALTPEEESRLAVDREVDPAIYQLYLKGMYFLKQYTPQGIAKGLPYLHQAVERDPANARAYAGLALGYNTIGHGIGRDAFPKALAAARRALELDEYSGEAWGALAEAQVYYAYDWQEADRSYRRALQLAPSLDEAHAHYAYLLALLERWDEAFTHSNRARELNPLDPTWAYFTGWLRMVRGEDILAEELFLEALELAPDFPFALWGLGDLYRIQGKTDEAIELQERIPRENPLRNWALGPTYALVGRESDALIIIENMTSDPGPKDLLLTALTYSALGDHDSAMYWLEACYEIRVDWLPWIALDFGFGGLLEEIRGDPRFQALLRKMDL